MARAGRPQGAPKGRTEAANELARLLREVTRGLTVRELAQRYGGGKTAWSEYRSGARIIALGRLNTVLKDQIRTPRLQGLLTEARRLHDLALTAEAAGRPVPSVEEALRQSRADLAESGRLVESLLAMVTLLRERVEDGGAGSAGASAAPPRPLSREASAEEAESAAAQEVRLRLDQAVDQLAAARSVEAAARQAVADAEAQRDAGAPHEVEIRSDTTELTDGTPAETAPAPVGPPSGTGPARLVDATASPARPDAAPPDAAQAAPGPPAVPAEPRFPALVDAALCVQLVRVGNALKQQRAEARWLWRRIQRIPSGLPTGPVSFHPYVVEGVVLERLDRSVAVPGVRVPTALPAGRDPRQGRRGRTTFALLGTVTALALLAAATLAGIVLARHDTAAAPGTTVYQEVPGALPAPSSPGAPSPSPSVSPSPSPSPTPPSPSAGRTTGGPSPAPTPSGRAPAPPLPMPVQPASHAGGTVYVLSRDRRSILRRTDQDPSWKVIGPAAVEIFAYAGGLFATDPTDGHISRYDESSRSWSQIGFPGDQFVTTRDGLYAISQHRDAVMHWTGVGSDWVGVGAAAARLYAGGAGLFATSPKDGALFRYSGYGSSWVDAGGPGADFAVGPDYVARISPDGKEVWQGSGRGSNWRRIGGPAKNLHAGGAGLFATDPARRILRYDGASGSWTAIGRAGVAVTVAGDAVYRIDTNGQTVSRWSGKGSDWTPLGTTASSIVTTD
ncbi:hypothetical protein [Streptomyces melanogenes]|uniref:hypothetical protein n=1 Tax=Streptomyces melanogenes TaxID=67326 RepID=UPI0037A2BC7A